MTFIEPEAPEPQIGPEPVAPAVFDTPEPPPAATTEDEVPFEALPAFWQEEITRKREAEATYRTRAKAYEEAFDGYDPEQKEAILEYVRLSRLAEAGDQTALAELQEMFGGEEEPPDNAPAPPPAELPDPYKAAEEVFERKWQEREQAERERQGIEAVRKAGEEAGFEFGTEDYILFVRGANEAANAGIEDPISVGKEAVAKYRQAIIDEYLKSKEQTAASTPAIPNGQGTAADLSTRPWTDDMSEAKKWAAVGASVEERLRRGA